MHLSHRALLSAPPSRPLLSSLLQPSQMPPVFRLEPASTRLQLPPNDLVTSVAATAGLLWVGTQSGHLLRHCTTTDHTDVLRGRLGAASVDNPVVRIFADPHSRAALVLLHNAYGYYAHPKGPLRPRWLAKLRGLRCVSAAWITNHPKHDHHVNNMLLLGTAYGALFSLAIDHKYERDDVLAKLWSAPTGQRIHGIRVESVAQKFVAVLATNSALYLFSDAHKLTDLFNHQRMTVLQRANVLPTPSHKFILPASLQFMTGSSGLSSRRFVWAGSHRLTHAQLAIRRRPIQRTTNDNQNGATSTNSTVVASIVDADTIPSAALNHNSPSAIPLAFNLSQFHVLVLYPDSISAFNHISGMLTQTVTLCNPHPNAPITPSQSTDIGGGSREDIKCSKYLSSPALGFARDALLNTLWVYTAQGELSRLVASNEEFTEAWKAAKAIGKFELAMALAPHVSSGMHDGAATLQTQEAVREAQADHEVNEGNWHVAAQLLAKTKRPIESVILGIVEAHSTSDLSSKPIVDGEVSLDSFGLGRRREMTQHIITYLVRKLDRMDCSQPRQRTIIATLLVQLYAFQVSSETREKLKEDVRRDFSLFLADRHQDLDTNTALSVLNRNGCYDEAWKLAVLSGDFISATKLLSNRGELDQALALLKKAAVTGNSDTVSQMIACMCSNLIPLAPQKVTSAIGRALKKEWHHGEHVGVVQALTRVAREAKDKDKRRSGYLSAVGFVFDLLHDWKDVGVNDDNKAHEWYTLVATLFQLHGEFGSEDDAQRSYEHLMAGRMEGKMTKETRNAGGAILRCAQSAGFRRLCVYLYQALGMHEMAIQQAVEIDGELAECRVAEVSKRHMSESMKKWLWWVVASKSDDAVGVVERSKGLLDIEDVLMKMAPFEWATERVKTAVAECLEEHNRLACVAKSNASAALEVIKNVRQDVEKAQIWRRRRRQGNGEEAILSCGHKSKTSSENGYRECGLCGSKAIESIEKGFEHGVSLAIVDKKKI